MTYDRHDRRVTEFDAERLSSPIDATTELLEEFPSE